MTAYNPDCPHHPDRLRTIRHTCLCCDRVDEERVTSFSLRSCAACRCVMGIEVVEDGKLLDWGKMRYRVLAKRGIKVMQMPEREVDGRS